MGQCVSQQPAFERVQVVVTEEEPRQRKFQSASLGRKSSRKHSIASLLPNGKGKTRRRKDDELSAAFNMSAVEFKVTPLLDINTAAEEELMTLSGISRPVAHEIIEHRNAIGGFKKIEDLALVSGVGAARLQLIKPEVCVTKKLSNSSMSVMTGAEASTSSLNGTGEAASTASSPKASEAVRRRRREPININTATIFQLMTVDGVSQELAAHLVHYRERKGPFKTLYDLRKVAGFNCRLISALGPYLATENVAVCRPQPATHLNGHASSHRRTASLPSGPLLSPIAMMQPARNHRQPSLEPPLIGKPVYPSVSQFSRAVDDGAGASHDLRPGVDQAARVSDAEKEDDEEETIDSPGDGALRLMTWNLDGLSVEKAANPGVVDVVAGILTRFHISVAVFHGVSQAPALQLLCDEINKRQQGQKKKSSRSDVSSHSDHSGRSYSDSTASAGYSSSSSQDNPKTQNGTEGDTFRCLLAADAAVGYLHRSAVRLEIHPASWTSSPDRTLALCAIQGPDLVGKQGATSVFALVSCSLKAPVNGVTPATAVPQMMRAAMDASPSERVLCLVDLPFNQHSPYVEQFQDLGYRPTVAVGESTSFAAGRHEVHTNILVNRYAQKAFEGRSGVIRHRLTHLLIPNGWSWNGPASTYCPVWLELGAIDSDDD